MVLECGKLPNNARKHKTVFVISRSSQKSKATEYKVKILIFEQFNNLILAKNNSENVVKYIQGKTFTSKQSFCWNISCYNLMTVFNNFSSFISSC